ncbi:protein phosphatase 2C domain-containing protein [Blastomonas aquatica]|uniref:PPM-type phosphatase domain-containing protein n=1 Tax=Blastomonas aquatica TaxID=1510276 RepID=A0ABQ1J9W6_9SPHN|nr:protein phosphatase 2C domain-containing protein [Blastomonas aquatica]GGB61730.1 hypothetical protein GCM10010833_15920 [Blastomonas aquatica]
MPLKELASVYDPDDDANADWIVRSPKAFFILDGASSLLGESIEGLSSASWLVRQIGKKLEAFEGPSVEAGMHSILEDIASQAQALDGASSKSDPPFCCLIGCIEHDDVIELVSWGDCQAIVSLGEDASCELFGFNSVALLDDAITRAVTAEKRAGTEHLEAFRKYVPQIVENRQKRNVDRGYQILDLRPPYVGIPERRFLDKRLAHRILLTTDGLFRAVTCYGMATLQEVASIDSQERLSDLLHRMREIEGGDKGCDLYPRLKPRDDVAAILLDFQPE